MTGLQKIIAFFNENVRLNFQRTMKICGKISTFFTSICAAKFYIGLHKKSVPLNFQIVKENFRHNFTRAKLNFWLNKVSSWKFTNFSTIFRLVLKLFAAVFYYFIVDFSDGRKKFTALLQLAKQIRSAANGGGLGVDYRVTFKIVKAN